MRRGFTLIELLVVISIIVLLVAIILPVLGESRESVRRALCASNQRQQVTALVNYAHDYKGWLPTYDVNEWLPHGDFYYADPNIPIWQWGLNYPRKHQVMRIWGAGKYLADARVNACPSLATRNSGTHSSDTMWTDPPYGGLPAYDFPKMARGEGDYRTYHLAYWWLSYLGNSLGPLDVPPGKPRINAFNIGDIAGTPTHDFLVRDASNYYAWANQPFNHASSRGTTYAETLPYVTGWNVGFPDGHVSWVKAP